MMSRKKSVIILSLLIALIAGIAVVLAYFNSTDSATNIFKLGNRYTLTYHANTGDAAEDAKITVPEQQKEYGKGTEPVDFTVSTDKPTRDGFVFKGWYEKEQPESGDTKYGEGGKATYTAPAAQKENHLYAQWAAGYTLIYDANGGEGLPDITKNSGEEVSGAKVTKETGDDSYTFTKLAAQGNMTGPKHKDTNDPDEMSSSNRVFLGWALSEKATEPDFTWDGKLAYANTAGDYDGTKTDGFAKSVEIIAADNPSKTVTLYAVWATKYELRFSYHPEMVNPKCGDPKKLQKPETLVSAANKAPTFNEQRWNVNAAGSPSDDDYGYTGKKLYAVWGP